MKKLFSIVILLVITVSILLSSCTEEVVKVSGDNGRQGQQGDF